MRTCIYINLVVIKWNNCFRSLERKITIEIATYSKSGDRLRRVQGISKFLTKPNPGQATDSTDILAVREILSTVVSNSQGTNLVQETMCNLFAHVSMPSSHAF